MSANADTNPNIKLKLGSNESLYQLKTEGGRVLAVDARGQLISVDPEDLEDEDDNDIPLENTLWCVTVTQEHKGQTPIYDFLNKGAQVFLDVTMDQPFDGEHSEGAAKLGGEIGGWAYSKTFEEGIDADYQPLFSYFKSDSVVGFQEGPGRLVLYKTLATEIENSDLLKVKLSIVDPLTLNADQINTKLGMLAKANKKVSLTFTPDRNKTSLKNPFSDVPFYAKDVDRDYGFVKIYRASDDSLLYVDTAYTNVNGAKFLAFNYAKDSARIADIFAQAEFNFTYFPTNDSLVIQVKQATYAPGADGSFKSALPGPDAKSIMTDVNDGEEAAKNIGEDNNRNYVTVQDLIKADEIRIVTIRNKKESDINLGFAGCKMAESNLTTLADGVYTIKNAKGRYFGIPVSNCLGDNSIPSRSLIIEEVLSAYEQITKVLPKGEAPYTTAQVDSIINSYKAAAFFPQWNIVKSDIQDLNHMPAYQWVVLKLKTTAPLDTVSPILLVNREFNLTLPMQLYKDSTGLLCASMFGLTIAKGITFTALADNVISDPYAGYKYMDQKEQMLTKYALNYFNPYNMNKFVSMEADSTLSAMSDAKVYFNIEPADTMIKYGITVSKTLLKRIPNLAQLKRTPFYMYSTIDGVKKYVAAAPKASTGEYTMIANSEGNRPVPFFFKENNHYNGQHYYAMMVADSAVYTLKFGGQNILNVDNISNDLINGLRNRGINPDDIVNEAILDSIDEAEGLKDYLKLAYTQLVEKLPWAPLCLKVGVADNSLNGALLYECGCEVSTSTFAFVPMDESLYRHFNNANLGEVEGTQSFKFVEKTRGEYLMDENNVNLQNKKWEADNNHTIDYLGIWTADKASLNGTALGLRLDTVWVNRGLGNIKPQYLISVDRHEVAGTDTIPCTESTPHHDVNGNVTDAMHCAHAIVGHAGYAYGKYLISFADSANVVPYTDVESGYYRLAFKPAIHQGDSLILLASDDQMAPIDSLSPLALIAKYGAKGYKGNGAILDLTGDKHKNYTWSFRYTNPGSGATATTEGVENEFLIESNNFDGQNIAPEYAAWVKMQNGCLCLTNASSEFNNAKTGGDGALIFNVKKLAAGDAMVTDAATVTASDFAVIAGEGQVTINGAAGKKVVVSNILGQTVANTVLTSDNATIAAPAGVVVVAVEGEAAVKAIVK